MFSSCYCITKEERIHSTQEHLHLFYNTSLNTDAQNGTWQDAQ